MCPSRAVGRACDPIRRVFLDKTTVSRPGPAVPPRSHGAPPTHIRARRCSPRDFGPWTQAGGGSPTLWVISLLSVPTHRPTGQILTTPTRSLRPLPPFPTTRARVSARLLRGAGNRQSAARPTPTASVPANADATNPEFPRAQKQLGKFPVGSLGKKATDLFWSVFPTTGLISANTRPSSASCMTHWGGPECGCRIVG